MKYIFVNDDDGNGHNYIIPKGKMYEWNRYVEAVGEYWRAKLFQSDSVAPKQPEWAVRIGGSIDLVSFDDYEIE